MRKKIENNYITKNNHTESSYLQEYRNCPLYDIILFFFLFISYVYGQGIHPKTEMLPSVYLFKGNEFAVEGNFSEAKEYFDKYFAMHSNSYISINDKIYLQLFNDLENKRLSKVAGQYIFKSMAFEYDRMNASEYLFYLNRASGIQSNYAIPYILRGIIHLYFKEYESALFEFNKAVEKDSINSIAYYYLGKTYHLLENVNAALHSLNKSLIFNNNMLDSYLERYKIYFLNDLYDRAIEDFGQVYKIDSTFIRGLEHGSKLNMIGIKYLAEKAYLQALNAFTLSLKADPRWPEPYLNRAKVYCQVGYHDLALKDINIALKLNPDTSATYYNRALIYLNLQKIPEAKEDLIQALVLDDQNSNAFFKLAKIYYDEKNFDKAIFYFKETIKCDKENIWARYWLGFCYDKKEDYRKALKYYREFYNLSPQKYKNHRKSIRNRIYTLEKYMKRY